jgi:putative inorganic carbon (hco3(-)) transporter
MRDWSMPSDSALEVKDSLPRSGKTSLPNLDSLPHPSSTLSESVHSVAELRWDLAFVAILIYLVVEYSRLQEMYPIFKPLHLAKAMVVLCILGLFFARRSYFEKRSSRGVDIALLAFWVSALFSVFFARAPELAWAAFVETLSWAVIYFLLSRILISSARLRVFVFLFLLLNFKLGQFVIRYYFLEISWGRSQQYLAAQGVGAGSTDFFGNSADLGVAMVVAWAIAGALIFGESKKFTRLLLLSSFVVFFGAILLCGSRGAVVGAAAVALAAWAKNPKKIAGIVILFFFIFGTYYFLPEGSREKMLSAMDYQHDPTAFHRTLLWKAGIKMFEEHPAFGVGFANFGRVYEEQFANDDPDRGRASARIEWVPHSTYIQALSETGLAGSLSLLALLILCFRLNARTRRQLKLLGRASQRSFEYRLSIGLDLALVGYLVSGAFVAVLYYPHLWFLLGLSVALHVTVLRQEPQTEPAEPESYDRRLVLTPY